MNTSPEIQKPKRRRPSIKRIAMVFVWLGTLLALAIVIENWTGARAWKAYVKQAEASGQSLDLNSIIPPRIPDEENFAAHPFIKALIEEKGYTSFQPEGILQNRPLGFYEWRKAKHVNLTEWRDFYRKHSEINTPKRLSELGQQNWVDCYQKLPETSPIRQSPAEEILYVLGMFDNDLASLREACLRSGNHFPINYETMATGREVRPYVALRRLGVFTMLRACAELNLKRPDAAFEDFALGWRTADSLAEEPMTVSLMLRIAFLQRMLQPVWEGLIGGQWSDTQLKAFEDRFREINFARDYQQTMRGDRIMFLQAIDYSKSHSTGALQLRRAYGYNPESAENYAVEWLAKRLPAGWYDHNKIPVAADYEKFLRYSHPETAKFDRVIFQQSESIPENNSLDHHLIARINFRNLAVSIEYCAAAQAGINLARIAVALERHRLIHKDYPETLSALDEMVVPEDGLPTDVLDGTPAHYLRISAERFLLYFNGSDGVDDKGAVAKSDWISSRDLEKSTDWVWPMPAE